MFTSEEYGRRSAGYMGARHVSVDPKRARFPVSGTRVRADPAAHWHLLEPCVRAWYVRRICVVGAESTGTTTLALALADHYDTKCVAEYGRLFCEEQLADGGTPDWRTEHFVTIATQQQADEDKAARSCGPLLICDTDALATSIWHWPCWRFTRPGRPRGPVDSTSRGGEPGTAVVLDEFVTRLGHPLCDRGT